MNDNYKNNRRNHITLRKLYQSFCESKELRRIFRPGNRIGNHPKAYETGQVAIIKILEIPGSDHYNIEPIHTDDEYQVRIINSQTKDIAELTEEDFKGAGPDKNIEALITNLSLIYNMHPNDIHEVTITSFEYLDSEKN